PSCAGRRERFAPHLSRRRVNSSPSPGHSCARGTAHVRTAAPGGATMTVPRRAGDPAAARTASEADTPDRRRGARRVESAAVVGVTRVGAEERAPGADRTAPADADGTIDPFGRAPETLMTMG